MCVIIDANKAADISSSNPSSASKVIVEWVTNRGGRLVHGGRLTKEIFQVKSAKRWFVQLQRAGRLLLVNHDEVNEREADLISKQKCKSNDPHVIALAQVSGARVLYSADVALHEDFSNSDLIFKPRGKIFQDAAHQHLIHKSKCSERSC